MLSKQYKQALIEIANALNNKQIHWAIGGSCLLYFHGIDVNPSDIDILIDVADQSLLKDILEQYPHSTTNANGMYKTKQFYTIMVHNITIDLMIDFAIQTTSGIHPFPFYVDHTIPYEKTTLPLSSLTAWKAAYEYMGRAETVRLIEQHQAFRIESERLYLTRLQYTDFEDVFQYMSDEKTMYYERRIYNRQSLSDLFPYMITNRLMYSLKQKADGQHVGHIYFAPQGHSDFKEYTIGYILHPQYHNRGYCTEAARAIIHYGFSQVGIHRVSARCNPDNIASWRVMEKIGLQKEGHLKRRVCFKQDDDGNPIWWDELIYGITTEDWNNNRQ